MTVSATPRVAGPFNGNDAVTVFAFTFKVYDKADLRVVLTDADDIEATAVLDSEYSVTLNGDQESSPGGTVAYPLVGAPLATGHKLTVVGDTAATQPLDVTNQGGFYPQVIEDALDRTTMLAQENRDELGRCVKVQVSSALDPAQLIDNIVASEAATAASAAASLSSANDSAASAAASQVSADDSAASAAASLVSAGASAASAAASLVSAGDSAASAGTAAADAAAGASAAVAASVAAAASSAADSATSAAESAASAIASAADALPFRNKIINGAFDVWQRGTNSVDSGSSYLFVADRWKHYARVGATGTVTPSRQFFPNGQTDVPGNPAYFFRSDCTVATSTGTQVVAMQAIEDVRTLSGQTVTLSFYARADAARDVGLRLDQNFGSGGSGTTFNYFSSAALTTTWQRFERTVTLPSVAGKTIGVSSALNLLFTRAEGTTYRIDLAGVQLEQGSVATPFEQRPIGMELALCQRYYQTSYQGATKPGTPGGGGAPSRFLDGAHNYGSILICLPTIMRIAPTTVIYNPSSGATDQMIADGVNRAAAILGQSDRYVRMWINNVSTGVSVGISGHYTADAEL